MALVVGLSLGLATTEEAGRKSVHEDNYGKLVEDGVNSAESVKSFHLFHRSASHAPLELGKNLSVVDSEGVLHHHLDYDFDVVHKWLLMSILLALWCLPPMHSDTNWPVSVTLQ